jgi:hypothetical protein
MKRRRDINGRFTIHKRREISFLTPEEVSEQYKGRITIRTLGNWRVTGGGLPYIRIGRILYPVRELEDCEDGNKFFAVDKRFGSEKMPPAVPPENPPELHP